jgi:phosphatidylinositol phospholipase C, delta
MINAEAAGPVILAETDGGTSTGFTSDPEPMTPERRGSFSLTRGRRGSKSRVLSQARPIVVPPAEKDETRDSLDGPILQGPKSPSSSKIKVFSPALAGLLVYTVGVKCRGINKKEHYAVEHMFSLSERKMDKMLREGSMHYAGVGDAEHTNIDGGPSGGMLDLIKHTQTHLVRTYPKGTRLKSTNYIPHRYWAAGAQLVAINWQTSGKILRLSSGNNH